MKASYSSVLLGKEEKSSPPPPPPPKMFLSPDFFMEERKKKKVQDFEEQSSDGLKKVKANWGNDSIFGTYGWSEQHSSSSGLSSPLGSELGSTETDETESGEDEDFIAQLTRQMADYMLNDDEEEEEDVSVDENDVADDNRVMNSTPNTVQAVSPNGLAGNWSNYNSMEICYYNQESLGTYVKPGGDSSVNHQMKNSSTVFYSCDDLKRPIQVYHLKDQPTTAKQKKSRGKRVKGTNTESVQKLKNEKNMMQSSTFTNKKTLGGHGHGGDKSYHLHHHPAQSSGVGMRAIFLGGGSGSINGPSGTGVFLPRTINNPNPTTTEPKKKSVSTNMGLKRTPFVDESVELRLDFVRLQYLLDQQTCHYQQSIFQVAHIVVPSFAGSSTVLIPARVLQALQQHFNHMDALSQSNTCAVSSSHLPKHENETEDLVSKENLVRSEDQTSVVNDQEVQLPQEWTY